MAIPVPNGSSASAPSRSGRGGRLALRVAPVGAHGQRAVGRIGDGVQLIEAAPHHRLAPHLVEIRHQRRQPRHGRMQIAVDRPRDRIGSAGHLHQQIAALDLHSRTPARSVSAGAHSALPVLHIEPRRRAAGTRCSHSPASHRRAGHIRGSRCCRWRGIRRPAGDTARSRDRPRAPHAPGPRPRPTRRHPHPTCFRHLALLVLARAVTCQPARRPAKTPVAGHVAQVPRLPALLRVGVAMLASCLWRIVVLVAVSAGIASVPPRRHR